MSAVCLLSTDCLHFAVLPLRHREKRGLPGDKVVGHEKWWFFSRSAVCLLLADCLLFAILSDMDSLTHCKDVGYEKFWILTMPAVCLLSADCLHFAVLPLRHREKRGFLETKLLGMKSDDFWAGVWRQVSIMVSDFKYTGPHFLSDIITLARKSIGPLPSSCLLDLH